ncbi:MAG: biotin--[acetyl-CoA-carboxylase] ligase [Pedobacter sp.]|nr:MAG: biotin--[acetyl-CoA-carboxylase] ligase [Pedobacter sp.]
MQNNTFSTLFVGQNLIKLSAVDSTNNFLKNLMANSEPLPEGTVIMADHQYAGRGQLQSKWDAEPGKNLTFSVLLRPTFLQVNKQFFLNIVVSLALNQVLNKILGEGVSIKWPNDIYFQERKIGGVLIENVIAGTGIKTSIIGVGINVNQQQFPAELTDKACSMFQILQKDVNLVNLLAEICNVMESIYMDFKKGSYTNLKKTYVDKLYRLNEVRLYKKDGEVFEGIIRGISDTGRLRMSISGDDFEFSFKEVAFLN